MAIEEPITPRVEMGVLKAITDAMMMTTRLMVLPTACVTWVWGWGEGEGEGFACVRGLGVGRTRARAEPACGVGTGMVQHGPRVR